MLKGTGDPKLGTDARNKQAMLSQFSGSVTGNIKGSYRGNQIALVFGEEHDDHDHEDHPVQTDEAKVAGTMTLTSPDREVAQNSTYELLYEGWITDCCGHDFNFEGEFKTDRATGRFEGTQIEGQITSGTDLGWPMQIQLQGVQYEA